MDDRTGIANIAPRTTVHALCCNELDRMRAIQRIVATAAATTVMRPDESSASRKIDVFQSTHIAMFYFLFSAFAFWIFAVSLRNSPTVKTRSSTIPTRNCSTEPEQNRPII
jgi:hypothetical protein